MIRETILVTCDEDGKPHLAPLGLTQDGDEWIAAPFSPSRTLDNLRRSCTFTASITDDVRVYAGLLTGRRDWPVQRATVIDGWYLDGAHTHREFEVVRIFENEVRPRFNARIVHEVAHLPAPGFNRAQAAVIELAILVSRLHMLPPEKIRAEIGYLNIAIVKTAGSREEEAWRWLMQRVDAHFAAAGNEAGHDDGARIAAALDRLAAAKDASTP